MRTHLIRRCVSTACLVVAIAASAYAQQPVFRGKVVDEKGTPVAGADMVFTAQFQSLVRNGKTDNKGEFLIVGLPSGEFEVKAMKDGVGEDTIRTRVTQGQNAPVTLTLRPAAPPASSLGIAPAAANSTAAKANQELQALAKTGAAHLAAGRNDEAIAAFKDVVGKAPTCADCFFNLGKAHSNKKEYADAETALKKAIELKADHVEAHTELTAVYNAQRKFDLAAESSAAAAKYAASAPGATGGNAEALYNQGVALFNGGKYPEAKTAFEGATKADAKHALAHYQLGMTALNLGDFALAVSSLEQYLVLDPNGAKAAEVKASLPALKGMVKK
jgi:tetratricopeptide (TPR) repeat protein